MTANNKKIFYTVLFIVFAFNIAVVGTLVYYFTTHTIILGDIDQAEIRDNFREMREQRPDIHVKYRENIKPLNDESRDLRIEFMKELVKPEPDYDELAKLNTRIQEVTQEISMNFYNEMIETRKTFSPEEAKRFYGFHVSMMLHRFDLEKRSGELPIENPDGGGMLSPHSGQGRFRKKRAFSEDN